MLKKIRTKIMAVVITIAMFLGQFAGMAGLQAASASNADIKMFLLKSIVALDNQQVETMFDLSAKIIDTEGALTAAQLKEMQDNNVLTDEMLVVLADIKQKLTENVLQKREVEGYLDLNALEQLMTDIKAGTPGKVLDTTVDVFWQIYQQFTKVPQSEMNTLFGTDITAAMQIATKRGLDQSTTQKILESLSTGEKTSLKEIVIATGSYAAEPSGGSGGGPGGGGGPVTTTTSTKQFTKEDLDKQMAGNAAGIVVNLKDFVEIKPEAMSEIARANKDIEVKNEDEKASITIPAGAVELPDGASLKVSIQPVSAEKSSKIMIALPSGVKAVTKIYDISAMNVKTGVESKVEFKKPISITLPYDPDAVGQGQEDKLVAYWFNPSTNSWVSMGGTVDKTAKTVTFKTDHLSEYALMIQNVTFADTTGHWAQSDIEAMAALNVVKGGPDGLFRPNSNITRAEFSAMLVRLLGIEPQQNGELTFKDVDNNKWYSSVVAAAYSNGLIQGYSESSFGPEDNITREQLATMVTRAFVYSGGAQPDSALAETKLNVFADRTDISSWAVNSTAMAVDKKIINGYPDGKFKPSASATRAEALVMLQRLLNVLKK